MNILITDDFDLGKIAGSGQCFRWKQMDAQTWRIIAGAECVYVSDFGDSHYAFNCDESSFRTRWACYFDLEE